MTKIKVAIRNYSFSDGELKQKADKCAGNVTRDILEFNDRGVTSTTVDDFKTITEDFDNIPTDKELEGDVIQATEKKNALEASLKVLIRTIRTMAQNKWGVTVAQYRSYGFEGMDEMKEADVHRLGKRVIRVATKQLTDLASQGLTAAKITILSDENKAFDKTMDDQENAIEDRDEATQTRVDAGNAVYAELVNLCNTGKDIWASTNEAKYNDYVIYDGPSAPAAPAAIPPVV